MNAMIHLPAVPATTSAVMNPALYTGTQQIAPANGFIPSTTNEISLWNDLQARVAQCNNLQTEIDDLQKKVDLLLKKSEQQNNKTEDYQTDEEDLAKETE